MKNATPTGIDQAIRLAGSQVKLAKLLGVSQQFIAKCQARGWMPPKRAVEVEVQLGVPRSQLINPRLRDLVEAGDLV